MWEEVLSRGWENFLDRTEGPMRLRFVIQPAVAVFLGVRAGFRDARLGRSAFFWSWLTQESSRRPLAKEALRDVGRVLFLATLMDGIYQLMVLRGIYLLELVFVAVLLAVIPYVFIRGPVNRIVRRLSRMRQVEHNE